VYWSDAGRRRFDVLVNGAAVLTNVDPYALARAKFTPVVREVTVTATGPTMVVSMRTRLDNAALAALEVSWWLIIASIGLTQVVLPLSVC
jgi:hypothetical protein